MAVGLALPLWNFKSREVAEASLLSRASEKELGVIEKIRPVLTTTFTAVTGILPQLLAQGPGAELQRPLAAVVVGGLLTSTAVTLLVLPLVYETLKRRA